MRYIYVMNSYRLYISFSLFLLLLLPVLHLNAQVSGRMLEEGTGLPVEGVLVRLGNALDRSDAEGRFSFPAADPGQLLHFSLLGYFSDSLAVRELPEDGIVQLRRNYSTLAETEVRDRGINVNDIIRRFARNIPDYYSLPQTALRYDFTALLYRGRDTLLRAHIPLFWRGSYPDYIGYESFTATGDSLRLGGKQLDQNWIEDYLAGWKILGSSDFPLTAFRRVRYKPEHYKVYVSVFSEKGTEYYDIVLITRKASAIRYNAEALRKGYGPGQNPAARRSYVSLLNFRIDKSRYVLVNYRDIAIALDDTEIERFGDISDRNMLNEWLGRAREQQARFYQMIASFAPAPEGDRRYVLSWRSLSDNLFCPLYRGKSEPGFTLEYLWRYIGQDTDLYRNLSVFNIQQMLLELQVREELQRREAQKEILRQQNVQRNFNQVLGR